MAEAILESLVGSVLGDGTSISSPIIGGSSAMYCSSGGNFSWRKVVENLMVKNSLCLPTEHAINIIMRTSVCNKAPSTASSIAGQNEML